MLPREIHLFGRAGPKPNQGSVPAGLTLAGDFGFCFQCQVGSSLVLRRPIEITRFIAKDRDLPAGGFQSESARRAAFVDDCSL
jgi:hypothetical protein